MQMYAQKKPTIMILPSDHWCDMRYFTTTYDNQGTKVKIPNYQQAFMEDTELGSVISKIGQVLTDMGYSLKDAEMVDECQDLRAPALRMLRALAGEQHKNDMYLSGDSRQRIYGGRVTLSQCGIAINNRSRILKLNYRTTSEIYDFAMQLQKAVEQNIKPFDKQMDKWYADQQKNGREIVLTIRCWDDWEEDLESEFDGVELTDCIQDWLRDNCVRGEFNLTDGTESFAQFEQVRIPMSDSRGNSIDARAFATDLRRYLGKAPFGITSKVMQRGLGEAILVLGEK